MPRPSCQCGPRGLPGDGLVEVGARTGCSRWHGSAQEDTDRGPRSLWAAPSALRRQRSSVSLSIIWTRWRSALASLFRTCESWPFSLARLPSHRRHRPPPGAATSLSIASAGPRRRRSVWARRLSDLAVPDWRHHRGSHGQGHGLPPAVSSSRLLRCPAGCSRRHWGRRRRDRTFCRRGTPVGADLPKSPVRGRVTMPTRRIGGGRYQHLHPLELAIAACPSAGPWPAQTFLLEIEVKFGSLDLVGDPALDTDATVLHVFVVGERQYGVIDHRHRQGGRLRAGPADRGW